jgi:hypothetical protein
MSGETTASKAEKFFDLKTVVFIIGSIVTIGVSIGVNQEKMNSIKSRITAIEQKISDFDKADLQSGLQRTELKVELSGMHSALNNMQLRIEEFNRRSLENKNDLDWLKRKMTP